MEKKINMKILSLSLMTVLFIGTAGVGYADKDGKDDLLTEKLTRSLVSDFRKVELTDPALLKENQQAKKQTKQVVEKKEDSLIKKDEKKEGSIATKVLNVVYDETCGFVLGRLGLGTLGSLAGKTLFTELVFMGLETTCGPAGWLLRPVYYVVSEACGYMGAVMVGAVGFNYGREPGKFLGGLLKKGGWFTATEIVPPVAKGLWKATAYTATNIIPTVAKKVGGWLSRGYNWLTTSKKESSRKNFPLREIFDTESTQVELDEAKRILKNIDMTQLVESA